MLLVVVMSASWMLAEALDETADGTDGMDEGAMVEPDEPVSGDTDVVEDASPVSSGQTQVVERLATAFHVEASQVEDLREQGLGYGEIHHVFALANQMPGGITQENVDAIMEMRQGEKMGWGHIAHEVGTTLGAAHQAPLTPTDPEVPPADEGDAAEVPSPTPVEAAHSLTREGTSKHGGAKSERRGMGMGSAATSPAVGHGRSGSSHGMGGGGGLGHGGGPASGGSHGHDGKSSQTPGHNR